MGKQPSQKRQAQRWESFSKALDYMRQDGAKKEQKSADNGATPAPAFRGTHDLPAEPQEAQK